MYHGWTPVAALTQVFIAMLSCWVYVSHSVTTSQPTPRGEKTEGKNECVTERESEKDRVECLFIELRKQARVLWAFTDSCSNRRARGRVVVAEQGAHL